MKTYSFMMSVALLFAFGNLSLAQSVKNDSLKVWGNCGMCKKKIETAATKAGASLANWDTETKMLSVRYNAKKTSAEKIEQAIAAVGYDTRNLTAPAEAYEKLPGCCQYDRKTDEPALKTEACCAHENCAKDGCKDMDCCKGKDCCAHKDAANCCKDAKCEKNSDCCRNDKGEKNGDCCKGNTSCKEKGCCKS